MIDIYASGEEYDAMHGSLAADIPFYVEEAQRAEPPVLELACGTGRVLIPVAQAGVHIWGLDLTPAMLARAQQKVAALPAEVQARITLQPGDMRDFDLEERFGLVMVPARSFLHLLTAEDQIKALGNIRRHLRPGGRLILNFFQPSIPIIAAHMTHTGRALKHFREWTDPQTGQRVVCWETRAYNAATQIIDETRVIDVVDDDGQVVDRYYRSLTLRWIYRYEFEHLLVRTGYEVEALYGDLDRAPFEEGSSEMVWIARRGG
jgi:SAM-dependent methyltransferase